jgi:hypothetical protein
MVYGSQFAQWMAVNYFHCSRRVSNAQDTGEHEQRGTAGSPRTPRNAGGDLRRSTRTYCW